MKSENVRSYKPTKILGFTAKIKKTFLYIKYIKH